MVLVLFLRPTVRVDLGTGDTAILITNMMKVQKDINSFKAANNSNATCTVGKGHD